MKSAWISDISSPRLKMLKALRFPCPSMFTTASSSMAVTAEKYTENSRQVTSAEADAGFSIAL